MIKTQKTLASSIARIYGGKRNKDTQATDWIPTDARLIAQSQNFRYGVWIPKASVNDAFMQPEMWNLKKSGLHPSFCNSSYSTCGGHARTQVRPLNWDRKGYRVVFSAIVRVNEKAVWLAPSFQQTDPRKCDLVCKTELSALLPLGGGGEKIYPLNGWKNQLCTRSTSFLILK